MMDTRAVPGGAILITGGAGFIGTNLADYLLSRGRRVTLLDAFVREGSRKNVAWLMARYPGEALRVFEGDVRDEAGMRSLVMEASHVVHLAAQVAVTTSLADPLCDFEVNAFGTLVVLEAVRQVTEADGRLRPFVLASTNKVYGTDLDVIAGETPEEGYRPRDKGLAARGIDETRPLQFATPYGCSKGVADQYALDYARSFGLPVAVLRMSCIMGEHQWGTEDQGWVAHFGWAALQGGPVTVYGDGHQVRDVLWVGDAVEAFARLLEKLDIGLQSVSGRAFNLGGGGANAVTVLGVLREIERLTGKRLSIRHAVWRTGDQRYFVTDRTAVTRALALRPPKAWGKALARMLAWQRLSLEGGACVGRASLSEVRASP